MALTQSRKLSQGSQAPDFALKDPRTGTTVAGEDFNGNPMLVVIMCNHCPFVIHLLESLVKRTDEFYEKGITTVAINPNDPDEYPADSPEKMVTMAENYGFNFPYLHDETQNVARAFAAVCTPEFYLFDDNHELYYHGQWDSSRPGKGVATGEDVVAAVRGLLNDEPAPTDVRAAAGCSIKWVTA